MMKKKRKKKKNVLVFDLFALRRRSFSRALATALSCSRTEKKTPHKKNMKNPSQLTLCVFNKKQ
jgi:hypothetical protein